MHKPYIPPLEHRRSISIGVERERCREYIGFRGTRDQHSTALDIHQQVSKPMKKTTILDCGDIMRVKRQDDYTPPYSASVAE